MLCDSMMFGVLALFSFVGYLDALTGTVHTLHVHITQVTTQAITLLVAYIYELRTLYYSHLVMGLAKNIYIEAYIITVNFLQKNCVSVFHCVSLCFTVLH